MAWTVDPGVQAVAAGDPPDLQVRLPELCQAARLD
jgi:hypothetical protein